MPGRGRSVRRATGLGSALVLAGAAVAFAAVPGYAACHSFNVSVNPSSVTEGGAATATITRDGSVADSSIMVDTVDGSAHAGRDYVAVHQRVAFAGSETSKTLPLTTIHNPAHEGSQTFQVQVSGGMGCTPPPHFAYGPPATVTVLDADPAPAPAPTQSHPATQPPAAVGTPTRSATTVPAPPATTSPTVVASPTPTPEVSPSPSATPLAATSPLGSRGSGNPAPLIVAVAAILALAGGALYWFRRRSVA